MRPSAIALLAAAIAAGCGPPPAVRSLATLRPDELPIDPAALEARAEEMYLRADLPSLENAMIILEKQMQLQPGRYEVLWRAARVGFQVADLCDNETPRREKFALRGERYGQAAMAAAPGRVEGHYYFATSLAYVALTQMLGAFEKLPRVAKAAKDAADIDERFDHAGPRRMLGTLLLRAPGWPASIGDVDEALTHLTRAVTLDPDYPPNRLFYAEALLANDRCDDAQRELAQFHADLDKAAAGSLDAILRRDLPRWRGYGAELKKKVDGKCR